MSKQPLSQEQMAAIDPFNTVCMTGLDAQTGMYFDADQSNSSILLKTADTAAMYIDKFQNMGINTTSPNAQLDVNSASSAHIQLTYNGSSTVKANIGVSSDGKLLLTPGGSEVAIDATSSLNVKSHNGSNLGLMLNNALVLATADQLNYNVVTPGTASNNKALVINSSGSIAGINSLSATSLTGTLQTAYQPNVTSVDTLDISSHNGISGLQLGGVQITATGAELNYVDTTPGTAQASKALVLNADRDIINIRNLVAENLTGTIQTAAQPNITSLGTLTGLSFDGPLTGLTELSINTDESGRTLVVNHESGNTLRMFYDAATNANNYVDMLVTNAGDLNVTAAGGNVDITTHDGAAAGLKLGGVLVTASADQMNYLQGTTPGASTAGKALVVDSNRSIGNINSLVASTLTGTIQTPAQPNIASVNALDITTHDGSNQGLKLNGTLVTSTAAELNYVDTTPGAAQALKAVVLDVDRNVTGISSLSADEIVGELQTAAQPNVTSVGTLTSLAVAGNVTMGSTTLSESEVAVLDSVIAGTVAASKVVVVDSNKDISSFRNLTAENLTGTLQTAAQPNITSVTTLNLTGHDGSAAGLALDGTLVTATATELNYVDTTPGAAEASKALVLDGNRDVSNIHALTADQLTGTLQTVAQPNVTSVGTLTSLSVAGDVTVGSTTLSQSEVAVLDGVTPGIVSASKALVVDADKNIATLNSLTSTTVNAGDVVATNVTGTLQTAAQPNITSVTTLDITGHDGTTTGLSLGGTLLTATAEQLNSIFGAGGEGTFNNLAVNDTLTLGGADGSSKGLVLGETLVTASGAELNYIDGSTPGTVVASKAVVVDENKDIASFRNLTAENLTGTLQTAAQPNVTSVGTLTSLAVAGSVTVGSTTLSESEVAVLDAVVPGTASASKALVVDSSKNISGINTVSASGLTLLANVQTYFDTYAALSNYSGSEVLNGGVSAYSPTLNRLVVFGGPVRNSNKMYSYTTYSTNATQYTYNSSTNPYCYGVCWDSAQSRFVAVAGSNNSATGISLQYYTSTNGSTWVNGGTMSYSFDVGVPISFHAASGHFIGMGLNKFYYSSNLTTWTTVNLTSGSINVSASDIPYASFVFIGNYAMPSNVILASGNLPIMYWNGTTWAEAGSFTSSAYMIKAYNSQEDTLYLFNKSRTNTDYTFEMQKIVNISTLSISAWQSSIQSSTLSLTDRIDGGFNAAFITEVGVLVYGSRLSADDSNYTYSGRILQIKNSAITKSLTLAGSSSPPRYSIIGSVPNKWADGTIGFPGMSWPVSQMTYFTPVNSSSGITFGSTSLSEAEMGVLDAVTAGTASASKALVVDASKNISGINALSAASLTSTAGTLVMNTTTISESEIGVLDAVVPGTVAASKAVVVDANKDISSFRNLTSVNLTSSAGSLTMGTTTINESEIGVLDAVVPGTASASKALVLDASKNIVGINDVSSATFTSTSGSLTMGATTINESEIGVLDAVTPGTISPSKAVVVDGNKDVSSFRNLTAVTLTATSGSLTMGGTNIDETEIGYLDNTVPGTATAFKALVPDNNNDIAGLNSLTAGTLDATTLKIAGVTYDASAMSVLDGVTHGEASADKAVILDENKSITGLGDVSADTLTSVDGSLTMGATNISESEIAVLDTVVPGTVLASHAVVVDENKDIASFRNLTATNLTGTLQTAAQPNVTSVGTLTSLAVAGDISTGGDLIVGTTTIDEAEIAVLDTVVPGTVLASHAVVVDENKDIASFRNLTATNLTGTLQTAAQPNVSSVTTLNITGHDGTTAGLALGGTLLTTTAAEINSLFDGTSDLTVVNEVVTTDLNLSGHDGATHGLKLSGSLVTANATEMNYLDGALPGHAVANKALIVDENVDVDGINALTAAELTGEIQTASQPKITSVTTLDITGHDGEEAGLSLGGVLLTATATQINSIFGDGGEGTFTNLRVNDTLTLANADGSSKGLVLGTTLVTTNGTELNYLDGSTPGSATAGNALVLDSSRNITNINSLTATDLTGTLQTAAQPNVTSVGTLTSLAVAGDVTMGTTTLSESEVAVLDGVVAGTVSASKALVVDANKDIATIRNLTAVNLTGTTVTGTLQTAAQPNVTSVGELTSLDVAGDVNVGGTLTVGGTIISEGEIAAIDAAVPGTATANKAMVTDSSNSIGGINSLSATTLTGTLQTAAQPNVTSVGTLTSLNVSGDANVGGTLTVGGTIISEGEIAAIDAAVPGTATANKAMVTDSANSIAGINSLTATSLTGTLQTASQPNLKEVVTLDITGHDGAEAGLELNGTLVTATATELNYVDTTPGSAQASKALVLDASKNISGINDVSMADLTATSGSFTNTTESDDTATGAIVTAGGVGIAKNLNVGGSAVVSTDLAVVGQTSTTGVVIMGNDTQSADAYSGALTVAGGAGVAKNLNVGGNVAITGTLSTTGALSQAGLVSITNDTQSTTTTNGSIVTAGGVGIAKNINVGGNAAVAGSFALTGSATLTGDVSNISITDSSSTTTGAIVTAGGVGIAKSLNVGGAAALGSTLSITGATTATGAVSIDNATASSSATTGALKVAGGVGIAGALNVGSTAAVSSDLSVGGVAAITGNTTIGGTAAITGNLSTNGSLTATGAATVGGSVTLVDGSSMSIYAMSVESDYLQAKTADGFKWNTGVDAEAAGSNVMELDTVLTVNVPEEVTDATDASSTTTGAFKVAGGVGIAKKLYVGSDASVAGNVAITGTLSQTGAVSVSNTTDSVDVDTGSIVTDGGVGIAKALNVGTTAAVAGNVSIGGTLSQTGSVSVLSSTDSESVSTGSIVTAGGVGIAKALNVGTTASVGGNVSIGGDLAQTGNVAIASEVDASSTTTGSFKTAGGAGVAKNLYVGGDVVVSGTITADGPMSQNGALTITDETDSTSTTTGAIITAGGVGIAKSVHVGGTITIENGAASADTATGALVVAGGVGVASDINMGGDLHVEGDEYLTGDLNLYGQLHTSNVNWTPDADSPFDTDPLTVITNNDLILSVNRDAGIGYLYNDQEFVVAPTLVTTESILYHGSIADGSAAWSALSLEGAALTAFNASYSDYVIKINQIVVRPWSDKIWIAGALYNTGMAVSVAVIMQGTLAGGITALYEVGSASTSSADLAVSRIAVATDDHNVAAIRYVSGTQADIYYADLTVASPTFAVSAEGNFGSINWLGGLGRFSATRAETSAIYTTTNVDATVWVDGTTPSNAVAHTIVFNTILNLAIAVGDNFIWYSTNGYIWSNCTYDALASGKTFGAVVNSPISALLAVYTQDQVYYSTDIVNWSKLAMSAEFGHNTPFSSVVAYDVAHHAYALGLNGASTTIQEIGPVTEASRVYRTTVSGGYMHTDAAAGYKWFVNSTGADEGTQLMRLNTTSLLLQPAVSVSSTTETTGVSSGSIVTAGGVGIAKSLTVGTNASVAGALSVTGATTQAGVLSVTNIADANSSTSGALKVAGGVGVSKSLYVGQNATIEGSLDVEGALNLTGSVALTSTVESLSPSTGSLTTAGGVGITKSLNVGIDATVDGDLSIGGSSSFTGLVAGLNNTDASSTSTGAIVTAGGVGIAKKLYVGSDASISGTVSVSGAAAFASAATISDLTDASSTSTGALKVAGGVGIAKKLYVGSDASVAGNMSVVGTSTLTGAAALLSETEASSTTTGALTVAGGVGIAKKLYVGGNASLAGDLSTSGLVSFSDLTDASSTTTGALKVAGGVGIAKKLYVGDGIYGTVMTGAQPYITSVNTLDILNHDGTQGLKLGGALLTSSAAELNYLDGSTPGAVVAGKAIVADSNRDIANINALTADEINGTIQTASQPLITSVNVLDIAGHDGETQGLSLDGVLLTATASQLNSLFEGDGDLTTVNATVTNNLTLSGHNGSDVGLILGSTLVTATGAELNYLDTTVGTVQPSKAIVVDANSSIDGINSLTATSLTGTIQTASQPNITSVTTLDITGHNGASAGLSLGGTLITSTGAELNYVDTTAGTAQASKALVLDANRDITNINSITATSYTGTLQTSAQPNITSVGSLTSLTIANAGTLTMGATEVSESDIAKIDGITNGTAAAGKALVLDSSSNIAGINNLGATSIALGAPTDADLPLEVGGIQFQYSGAVAYHNGQNSLGIINANEGEMALYSARFEGRVLCQEIQMTSDARLKKNVEDLELSLAKNVIDKIRPVSFNWNSHMYGDDKRVIGFIAQELERLEVPGLVTLAPAQGLEEQVDEDGFVSPANAKFTVSTDKLVPILSLTTKDLYKLNEEKDAKIASLEERIAALEAAIAKLL